MTAAGARPLRGPSSGCAGRAINHSFGGLVLAVSCAVHSSRQADVRPGHHVLVTGAGPIGLLLVQVLLASGAAEVVVVDPHASKRQVAERLGATVVDAADAFPAGPFDAFIEASGSPAALVDGILSVGPRGTAVIVGLLPDGVAFPADHVLSREIAVRGSFRYRNTWLLAEHLVSSGAVDVDVLVTGRYTLADAATALRRAAPGERRIKSVVYPGVDDLAVAGAGVAGSPYGPDWARTSDGIVASRTVSGHERPDSGQEGGDR